MKVLLVDDNIELLAATRDVLEVLGHGVVALSSAEAALDQQAGGDFDVLVTDYLLPGLTGLELIRQWGESSVHKVLMTSHAQDPEVIAGGARLGVPILGKPFSVKELEEALAVTRRQKGSGSVLGSAFGSGGRIVHHDPHRTARPALATRRASPIIRRGSAIPKAEDEATTVGTTRKGVEQVGLRALAVAAALTLVAGMATLLDGRAPSVPRPPSLDVVRGAILEVQTPLGPLVDFPTELAWQPVEGVWRFVVWLEAVDGRVLYQGEIVDTRLPLPDEVLEKLQPGVAYHWWVEALSEHGARLARSEKTRFRVIQALAPVEIEETTR